jgi:cytochrome c oxidase subunit 1
VNAFVTVVTLLVGVAQVLFFFNVAMSLINGRKSERNPWKATTLEWQTADFPPGHGNFADDLPLVHRWAYDFSMPGAAQDYVPQNMAPDEVPQAGQSSAGEEASKA